ncbi:MAG: anaerobic sulfatase-maturation protein [Bacteroides sp.]|nr:anaerobic sulfatase-maturation protein [Bacteroides sp.]
MSTAFPFAKPVYVMLKPVGAQCNLACAYCYYLEKAKLVHDGSGQLMSEELLETFTKEYIQSQTMPQVLFTWHGGETLLRPLDFYRKALEFQRKYAGGRIIDNCIQTNGTLLTDEWCRFFKENNWLVGVSIDGPQRFHDAFRKNKQGQPSFDKVMRGIELLNKHGVEWNAMAVVNGYNVEYPLEFYRFFKSIGCRYIQFTPVVERIKHSEDGRMLAHAEEEDCPLTDLSVNPEQWGNFLCVLFDEWIRTDVGRYFIQLFDATLANWVGEEPGICSMARSCGKALAMEFNGDLYACDHYVFSEYKLGNIRSHSLAGMLYGKEQMAFGENKWRKLTSRCNECKYLFACNGECPKNRFVKLDNEPYKQNYLCKGYYRFFEHVAPFMEYMKKELLAQRAPANVMEALRQGLL